MDKLNKVNIYNNFKGGSRNWEKRFLNNQYNTNIHEMNLDKELEPGYTKYRLRKKRNTFREGINSIDLKNTTNDFGVSNKNCEEVFTTNMNPNCDDVNQNSASLRFMSSLLFNNPNNYKSGKAFGFGPTRLITKHPDIFLFFKGFYQAGKLYKDYIAKEGYKDDKVEDAANILLVIAALHNLSVMADKELGTGDIQLESFQDFKNNFINRLFDSNISDEDKKEFTDKMEEHGTWDWIEWMMNYVSINRKIFRNKPDRSLFFSEAFRVKHVEDYSQNIINNQNNNYTILLKPIQDRLNMVNNTIYGNVLRLKGGSQKKKVNNTYPEYKHNNYLIGGGNNTPWEINRVFSTYDMILEMITTRLKKHNKKIDETDYMKLNQQMGHIKSQLLELHKIFEILEQYTSNNNNIDNSNNNLLIDDMINKSNNNIDNIDNNKNNLHNILVQLMNMYS